MIEDWYSVCPYVPSFAIRFEFFYVLRFYVDFIQFSLSLSQNSSNMNNNDVTGRIRWINRDLTSTISKIKRSQYEIKVKGGEEEKEEDVDSEHVETRVQISTIDSYSQDMYPRSILVRGCVTADTIICFSLQILTFDANCKKRRRRSLCSAEA